MADPTETDPDKYAVVFENERVRVLEYRDEPGARAETHDHPDSVMITLSGFDRRLTVGDRTREVALGPAENPVARCPVPLRRRTSAGRPRTSSSSS